MFRKISLPLLLVFLVVSCAQGRYVVSDRTYTLKINQTFKQQLTHRNTAYIICQDYNLQGESVTIPEGCSLVFEGGSISNGTLTGNDTYVELRQETPAFNDVLLSGSFVAHKFPINAYSTNKLDYFNSFLQAFSGVELYLTEDYSATEYLGQSDGATPQSLYIDGKGHKLTLYSFGANKMSDCSLKDITIEATHNITPKNKWKSDKFNFGIVGSFDNSTILLDNVTFTNETGFAYFRGFKNLEIKNCKEDGSYFFVYDCNNVSFHNNEIVNAANGYYSIGRMTEEGQVKIYDNVFRNISGGGAILSGGLKYNVSICNNVFDRVGSGGAMKSCINIHPRGTIVVSNNRISANEGASSLDIDAARVELYDDATKVTVKNNVIERAAGGESLNGVALVGLAKLYFKNNKITNQRFSFWDTPYMEFTGNTVTFTEGFDKNTDIGAMTTHETTANKQYLHIYKKNVFVIPEAKGSVRFKYQSKEPVQIVGKRNKFSRPVEFMDQNKSLEASGDIQIKK